MKPIYVTAALFGALISSTAVLADSGSKAERAEARFNALDTDKSGEVTMEEFAARQDARFLEADANGDGLLAKDELLAAGQRQNEERVSRMIDRFDKDGDGQLSQAELPKPRDAGKRFSRIDTDNSGGVSLEEFRAARDGRRGHREKSRQGDKG
jgi:Ca2+-binding EF-hand superfamily protein